MTVLQEDEVIIFRKEDGGVAVINVHPDHRITIQEVVDRVLKPGQPYKVVKKDTLPTDGMYRDAWKWED